MQAVPEPKPTCQEDCNYVSVAGAGNTLYPAAPSLKCKVWSLWALVALEAVAVTEAMGVLRLMSAL